MTPPAIQGDSFPVSHRRTPRAARLAGNDLGVLPIFLALAAFSLALLTYY